jgi:hypothetical protein
MLATLAALLLFCYPHLLLAQQHADEEARQRYFVSLETAINMMRAATWHIDWDRLGLGDGGALETRRSEAQALAGRQLALNLYTRCLNARYSTQTAADRMSFSAALANDEQKGVIATAASFWTNHLVPAAMTTAVTSSSIDRLQQLYAQCKSWNGPLSIVLYQALFPVNDGDSNDGKRLSAVNQATLRNAVLQASSTGWLDVCRVHNTCLSLKR